MREIKFRAWDGEKMIYDMRLSAKEYAEGVRVCSWPGYEFMQYTGLTNKLGQEIYEGDILSDGGKIKGEVAFGEWNCSCCDGVFGYYLDTNKAEGYADFRSSFRYEVVGNIYENPELLEGK